jgi:hypothetical protein
MRIGRSEARLSEAGQRPKNAFLQQITPHPFAHHTKAASAEPAESLDGEYWTTTKKNKDD